MEVEFYTVEQFAKKVSLHPNTIRIAIRHGRINAFRPGIGKKSPYRIPALEVDRLLSQDFHQRNLKYEDAVCLEEMKDAEKR